MNKYGLIDSAPKRWTPGRAARAIGYALAILGGVGFWFLMLWFRTKG